MPAVDEETLPESVLVEADLFISYLTRDQLEPYFGPVVDYSTQGKLRLLSCSELYDDVATALRSQKASLEEVGNFLQDMKTIPHDPLPVTADIAATAIDLYRTHGGSRKLHYFDSYHVATARIENFPLLTSDKYIISRSEQLGIKAIDVREIRLGQK